MVPRASVWDHKSDKDLLLAIIEMGTLKSIMWPEISLKMQAKGYSFTNEACRQHFQKIRREASGVSGANNGDQSPSQEKKTKAKTTPKSNKIQKESFTNGYGDDDDDEEDMNQSAKRKRIKSEAKGFEFSGQHVQQIKLEDSPTYDPIDLVNDDIYEADYPDYV